MQLLARSLIDVVSEVGEPRVDGGLSYSAFPKTLVEGLNLAQELLSICARCICGHGAAVGLTITVTVSCVIIEAEWFRRVIRPRERIVSSAISSTTSPCSCASTVR